LDDLFAEYYKAKDKYNCHYQKKVPTTGWCRRLNYSHDLFLLGKRAPEYELAVTSKCTGKKVNKRLSLGCFLSW
jgi:hypothetical protein